MPNSYKLLVWLIPLLGLNDIASSQDQVKDSLQNKTINVFIDCRRCSETYIRNEISYVNYVRNKEDAELHLLITRQPTGSGGDEYTLRFIGSRQFEGKDETLTYISPKSDTRDESRSGLVNRIGLGLIPYLYSNPVMDQMQISYQNEDKEVQSVSETDSWNYWVFEFDVFSSLSGEETQNRFFITTGANASRITEDWKIRLAYDWDYNRRSFEREESNDVFITRGQELDGLVVKSLSDHWSVGMFSEASRSTRNNIHLSVSGSPAIEYNFFPYHEYAQREFSIMYTISPNYYNYREETIFGKTEETLVRQRLRTRIEFNQPWGEFEGRINATTFLHDLNKNRFDVDLELDFRIFRGLSFSVSSRYSWIHDQLYIPIGEITDAEQLLNLRQQATSYSYRLSFGIEYSFGSIYNNIVNPRF